MAIAQPFTTYAPGKVPDRVGVYELARPAPTDSGYKVVYIGSGRLADRVSRHRRSDKQWCVYRVELTASTRRARQRERVHQRRFLDREGRLPRYNDRIG
jgi:hypothetical protein